MSREAMQIALDALEANLGNWAAKTKAVEVLRQALGAEQKTAISPGKGTGFNYFRASAITVLRQPQEPVAWRTFDGEGGYDYRSYEMNENYDKEWAERNPNHAHWVEPLYTAPQKQWVGLTDDAVFELADTNLYDGGKNYGVLAFAKAIEQALKDKNA